MCIMQRDNIVSVWYNLANFLTAPALLRVFVLSSSKLYVACSVCSLMPGSADSSVGDMQAAARAEQSGAEQADCWNQWPSKNTAGRIRALPEGGERGMTVSRCLPVCICSCSVLSPEGVDGAVVVVVMVGI